MYQSVSKPQRRYYKILQLLVFISFDTILTHCGLVTSCGDIDLGQHWLRWWLVCCLTAPSHYQNQCWLFITNRLSGMSFHCLRYLSHQSLILACLSSILFTYTRGQWVKQHVMDKDQKQVSGLTISGSWTMISQKLHNNGHLLFSVSMPLMIRPLLILV